MKFLLMSVLAALLGLGWFGFRAEASGDVQACTQDACCAETDDCEVSAECLPDGTCRIECEGPAGESCWAILACDADGGCEVVESGGDCCAGAESASAEVEIAGTAGACCATKEE